MRPFLILIAIPLVVGSSGCATTNVPTNPDNYSIKPDAVSHLRAPQAVAFINGYPGETNAQFKIQSNTLVIEQKQLTETAIVMLSRAMEKQGYTRSAQAGKTIALRVRVQGFRMQMFRWTGRVLLQAYLGDGTVLSFPNESLSPKGWENAFDGAVLFALNDLLEDERFVAYMNRTTPPAAAVSSTACGETSPTTWTNCVGTYAVPDGSKYVGEFKDGKYDGQGELTLANGTKYKGEFRDGRYHGQGVATRPDGSLIHSGLWADGRPW